MRRALTLQERLDEARAELWLCRLSCDLTLARWAASIPPETTPASATPEAPVEPATPWPAWRPIWLHDRCAPAALTA
ncbi:MAG TPA: hypothetical protein VFX50_13015 [Gemmatimonadales bacterium]|nr:hypothetical protein [Gemmatimonadales bacterium]